MRNHIMRQFCFACSRVRHVEQRARRSEYNTVFAFYDSFNFFYKCAFLFIFSTPYILAAHDTCKQDSLFRKAVLLNQRKILPSLDKIKADAVKAKCAHVVIYVANIAEICLKQDTHAAFAVYLIKQRSVQ